MDVHKVAARGISAGRRHLSISGFTVRIMIALVISWLIIMAFFVTGAVSH
jgi:hypothetical protein